MLSQIGFQKPKPDQEKPENRNTKLKKNRNPKKKPEI